MRTTQQHNYVLCKRCYENATWILTDKHSKEQRHCNYSEMETLVTEAYLSHANPQDKDSPDALEEMDAVNANVRCLHQGSCMIFRRYPSRVEFVNFESILPNYDIDCYGWHYQCPHCKLPLDETRKKGQQRMETLVCQHCFEILNNYNLSHKHCRARSLCLAIV
jgi:hypothetical protein